jgi:hypothetical protein
VRRLALQLGEDGRVIAPPELVAEIRDAATAALANYVVLSAAARRPPAQTGCRVDSGRERRLRR